MRTVFPYPMYLLVSILMSLVSTHAFANSSTKNLTRDKYPFANSQILRFVGCSKGKVSIIPVRNENGEFLIISNRLDEECFETISGETAKRLPGETTEQYNAKMKFEWKKSRNGDQNYRSAQIHSPFHLACSEKCKYMEESILAIADNYYFLSYPSDWGITAELINKNAIWFGVQMATHQRNFTFQINEELLVHLPNGETEFYDDYILVKRQKSYFEGGGAFWFDSKRDYSGNIIEYIDRSDGTCVSSSRFHENMKNSLIGIGKKEFCVLR